MQEAESQRQCAKRKRSSVDLQELQAELVCSVCQDWIVHASSLECGHSFCRECIDQWLTGKKIRMPSLPWAGAEGANGKPRIGHHCGEGGAREL